MIKSSIICVLRFLECLIANKYTYQIWDPNSHWKSDFLSRVFLQSRSAITETKNVRAKGEGLDRGRPGLPVTSSYPQKLKEKFFLVIFIVQRCPCCYVVQDCSNSLQSERGNFFAQAKERCGTHFSNMQRELQPQGALY